LDAGGESLKRFSLIFALFWSLQGAICLAPVHTHANTPVEHHHEAVDLDHSDHDPAPSAPSDSPMSSEHCSSLSWTLSTSAPAAPAPMVVTLAHAPACAPRSLPAAEIREIDAAIAHPPPDLVLLHVSFRS
jgi:hypothetical protein